MGGLRFDAFVKENGVLLVFGSGLMILGESFIKSFAVLKPSEFDFVFVFVYVFVDVGMNGD